LEKTNLGMWEEKSGRRGDSVYKDRKYENAVKKRGLGNNKAISSRNQKNTQKRMGGGGEREKKKSVKSVGDSPCGVFVGKTLKYLIRGKK